MSDSTTERAETADSKPAKSTKAKRFVGRFRKLAVTMLVLIAGFYGLGMVVYLLLRLVVGDALWPVALTSAVLHWALLPAFPLLLLMLGMKRRIPSALLAISAASYFWYFGELFLPNEVFGAESHGEHQEQQELTVMTFNLGYHRAPPQRVVRAIRESDADLVALEEVSRVQEEAIESALAELFPHRVFHGPRARRKGLLSRHPIVSHEAIVDADLGLHALRGQIDHRPSGQELTVFVVHPPRPALNRREGYRIHPLANPQIEELGRRAEAADGPVIVMGDFNMTDQSDAYLHMLRSGLTDAFREAGFGYGTTWPTRHYLVPMSHLVRIDYIWHSSHFRAQESWVGSDYGSDHLPVLSRLELN